MISNIQFLKFVRKSTNQAINIGNIEYQTLINIIYIKMANGVNTEWFDQNVKHGNFLPKLKEKSLTEVQMAEQQKHEEQNKLENVLDKKNMEEIDQMEDDLDFDDDFMRQYMAKRKAEITEKASKYKYGTLLQISRDEYLREVTNADPDSFVVLHLYQNSNQFCMLINQKLQVIANKYGEVKFIKIIANKCIEKFPDENCPCFIIYKAGKPVSHITKVDKIMKEDINKLQDFLKFQGVPLQE